MHRVAWAQDAGRAPLGQQPAQPGGGVGDVLPEVRGGLAVLGVFGVFRVFGLGAVLSRGAGQQVDFVAFAGQHAQGAPGVPLDVELAVGGVPPGDGALVAGPEPGVGVVRVDEGDAVAGLVRGGAGHGRGWSSPFAVRQASHPLMGAMAGLSFLRSRFSPSPVSTASFAVRPEAAARDWPGPVGEFRLHFHQVGQGGVGKQREQLRGGVSVHVPVDGGGVLGGDLGHVVVDDLPQVLVHRRACPFFHLPEAAPGGGQSSRPPGAALPGVPGSAGELGDKAYFIVFESGRAAARGSHQMRGRGRQLAAVD